MYATLTTTLGDVTDDMRGVASIAGEAMEQWLREIEGFEGLVMLSDPSSGTTHVITFWESREVAERHEVARMQLRDRITATVSVEVEKTQSYDVSFARFPRACD